MDRVRDAVASRWGRVVAVGLLLLGMVTAVPAFSASASAHQSYIDASVSCEGTVSWTAKSWKSDDEGRHGDVRVWSEYSDGESHDVEHGSFSSDNGYQFSGTFDWPTGVSSMSLHSKPNGAWGNGETSEDGDEVVIAKPEDCEHHPEIGKSLECEDDAPGYGDGAATFTLTNPAGPFGDDADFSLSGPDGEKGGDYHVPSGEHQQVTYHDLSDGHHSVHVKVGDEEYDEEFEIDCDESMPSVENSQACVAGDGIITVNLSNTGGDAVEFTVENPVTAEVEHIMLQPNQSASRSFDGLADGEYWVPVFAGEQDLSQQFTVDCDPDDDVDHPGDECPSDDGSDDNGPEGSSPSSTDSEQSAYGITDYSGPSSTEGDGDGGEGGEDCTPKPPECPADDDGDDNDHDGPVGSSPSSTDAEQSTYGLTDYSGPSSTDGEDDGDGDGDGHDCVDDDGAEGAVRIAEACVGLDGQVTITLVHVKGEDDLDFVVNGVTYTVHRGATKDVVIGGLTDGTHHFTVIAGNQDLSFDVTIHCDLAPQVTTSQECVDFDGSLTLKLENLGDDVDAVFTIGDVDHVVAPLSSETVTVPGLPDGTTTITLAINGVEQPDIVVSFDCDPVFKVVAECNTIGSDGVVQMFWFTITNTESTSVDVSWNGGSTAVPAGESRTVATTSPVISIVNDGVEIASAQATNVVCSRTVTVQKQVIGEPPTPETYTVTISRVVGTTVTPEVSLDLVAGETRTVALPSTLDPAGIKYSVAETATGTAATSVVTPSSLTLSGHLGQTVSIVVTNGYSQSLPPLPPPPVPPVSSTSTTTPASSTSTTTSTTAPKPGVTTTTSVTQGGPVPPTTTVTTTTTVNQGGPLPVSGGTPLPTLLIGFGLSSLGAAMLMVRRRPAAR